MHAINKSGWYRIFNFIDTSYGEFFIGKIWRVGPPAASLVAFNCRSISAILKTIKNTSFFHKARVVQKTDREYHIDIWYNAEDLNDCWIEEVSGRGYDFVDFENVPNEIAGVLSEVSLS